MTKKWRFFCEALKSKTPVHRRQEIVAALLKKRKIKDRESFFSPPSPFKVDFQQVGICASEVEKVKKRLSLAKKRHEQILVWGDYDVDGIAATAILWEALWENGFDALPYIPQREEGYGLHPEVFLKIKKDHPQIGLVITVDNGITAAKEVEALMQNGVDVIVTDHHLKEKVLPPAKAIIWSDQVCGAAVAWFLVRALFSLPAHKLDLVALATVADLMPLVGINRSLVYHGLAHLIQTPRLGLRALYQEAGISDRILDTYHLAFIIAPRLNAAGRLKTALDSLRLLCTKDKERALSLAKKLGQINKERQALTETMFLEAEEQIRRQKQEKDSLLFVASDSFHPGVVGLIAGRLLEKFSRPVIAVSVGPASSRASCRSLAGFNIVRALRRLDSFLLEVGGHAHAAGFTIETKNLPLFKKKIKKLAQEKLSGRHLRPYLDIDCLVNFRDLNLSLYDELEKFSPFGLGNPHPLLATRGVIIEGIKRVGRDKNHLKLILKDPTVSSFSYQEAIGFGQGNQTLKIGEKVDIAYRLLVNEWGGQRKLELKIEDIKKNG